MKVIILQTVGNPWKGSNIKVCQKPSNYSYSEVFENVKNVSFLLILKRYFTVKFLHLISGIKICWSNLHIWSLTWLNDNTALLEDNINPFTLGLIQRKIPYKDGIGSPITILMSGTIFLYKKRANGIIIVIGTYCPLQFLFQWEKERIAQIKFLQKSVHFPVQWNTQLIWKS